MANEIGYKIQAPVLPNGKKAICIPAIELRIINLHSERENITLAEAVDMVLSGQVVDADKETACF